METIKQLKEEIVKLEAKVEELYPEAVAAERFLDDLNDEIDELESKIYDLEDKIWDLENEDIGPC